MFLAIIWNILILCASGPLQPDGCKQSVLLAFSYVIEKWAIFPAFSSMLLLFMPCQQIINNNLMKEVYAYFS